MTAIAAAIALSSTQAFAQDAAAVVDAPPAPVVVPEAVAPAPEPVAAETAAPAEERAEPVAQTAAQQSAPVAARSTRAAAPVRRAAAPAATPAASPVIRAAAPAAAVATPVAAPEPAAAPADSPVPPPIPIQQPAPAQAEASAADDMLPIAGAAGVGVLALVGGAVAMNRRRRRHDGVAYEPETVESDHVAAVEPEPAPVVPLAARTAPEPTAMPAGHDLSRFGRHTQAAYRGPTPDNPSLSLKRRLKRASFLDGRERTAHGGSVAMPDPMPVSAATGGAVTTKVEQARAASAPSFAPKRTTRPASQPLFGFGQPSFQS